MVFYFFWIKIKGILEKNWLDEEDNGKHRRRRCKRRGDETYQFLVLHFLKF